MSLPLKEFISGLPGLRTADDLTAALDGFLRNAGFGQFSYVGIQGDAVQDKHLTDVAPEAIHLTNRPDWTRQYISQNYVKSDPVVRETIVSRLPIQWTETFMLSTRRAARAVKSSFGRSDRKFPKSGFRSDVISTSNARKTMGRMICISIIAKPEPMHTRGPAPNGK